MADRRAGTISIRLAVKDGEVVRQALDRLGKDGRRALNAIDTAARQPSRGVRAFNQVLAQSQSQLAAWAGGIGAAGAALARMSPTGLVAAGAIGAVALALARAARSAHVFARDMLALRDTARTIGLTVEQLQAVVDAGSDFALSSERVRAGLERLSSQLDEARQATGALYKSVRQISPALADELTGTRNTAEALDLLGRAYRATDDAAKKARVSKDAFGRTAGFGLGLLTQLIATQGGVDALTAAFLRTGDAIDPGLVDRTSTLKAQIDDMAADARRNIESMFSERALRLQHRFTEQIREMSRLLKDGELVGGLKELANVTAGIVSLGYWQPFSRGGPDSGAASGGAAPGPLKITVTPARKPDEPKLSPEAELNRERQRLKVLGEAATATDRLRLRKLELAVATDNWTEYAEEGNRALAAFNETAGRAAVAARTQLGIATQAERERQIVVDVARASAEGFIRNEQERAQAIEIATRKVREQIEAEQIRASLTPELTRLSLESQNTLKAVDQVASQSFDAIGDKLAEFGVNLATGKAQLRDFGAAFSEMAASVASDLLRIAVTKAILGPATGGLSGILGGIFPSARGNVLEGGRIIPFAAGGVLTRPTLFPLANGIGLAGEAGPEAIMPLKRINGRLGVEARGMGSNTTVNFAPTINVTMPAGAKPEDGKRFGDAINRQIERHMEVVAEKVLERNMRGGGKLSR